MLVLGVEGRIGYRLSFLLLLGDIMQGVPACEKLPKHCLQLLY